MSQKDDPGRSLPEFHRSVAIPPTGNWLRRLFAFAGPAYLVSVGYMDPGNWATDLAGGSRLGYQLIWVLLMSNLMAVLLQTLSARLGVVTGKDLAQACREYYPHWVAFPLWVLCEIAIIACDLAEVLGAAIGLKLLFGIPVLWGVLITAADVMLLLALSRFGMRRLEAFIVTLVATIGGCFAMEMILSRPDVPEILRHLIPQDATGAVTLFGRSASGGWTVLGLDHQALYIAMGILGATVMPHNLYLHSALVQSRAVSASDAGKKEACRLNLVDSAVALNAAFFVNAAILVLAAAVFHRAGQTEVAQLEEAHRLLAPLLGTALASTLFAVALLCAGQASTITGTLAGQIVMEGFLRIRIRPWLRRLISRSLAIVPAAITIVVRGAEAVDDLLVLSQVVLSLQLSFAVIPLITFTSDRAKMGKFANSWWVIVLSLVTATIIVGLNANLVAQEVTGWFAEAGAYKGWLLAIVVPVLVFFAGLLLYVIFAPWLQRIAPALAHRPAETPAFATAGAPALAAAESHSAVEAVAPAAVAGSQPLPRRIAVALEMGFADAPVIEYVLSMPRASDAEIVFVHVAESAASRYLGTESSDQEARADTASLEALAERFRAQGIPTRVELGHGDVIPELARIVNAMEADLLITGSHGHRLIGDIVHGATTGGVRHRVRCAILTVPPVPKRK